MLTMMPALLYTRPHVRGVLNRPMVILLLLLTVGASLAPPATTSSADSSDHWPAARVSPRSIPIDGGAVTVCLVGTAPPAGAALTFANQATCGLSHGDGDGNDLLYFNANAKYSANFTATRIVNATCTVCELPPVIVPGAVHLALGMPDPTTGTMGPWRTCCHFTHLSLAVPMII
jgi:hypothetical protein